MIKTCPIVTWYKFYQCDITTCKNYTTETKHRCLELDRKRPEGTKQFSDAELNLYKLRHRNISTRLVQIYRKNAVQNVKLILILRRFIEWINDNFEPRREFPQKEIRQFEKEYPLKIRRLGWKNWMWEYFVDDAVWQRFTQKLDGEHKQVTPQQLLGVKPARYKDLLNNLQLK